MYDKDGERPHRCPTCNASFTRTSHLKRHSRLHAEISIYRCLCGRSFSRNDGLSRHFRRCSIAQQDVTTVETFAYISSMKQTRDKRACDTCARLKLKCTFDDPCERCRRKSLDCSYTRNGYIDPYGQFRVESDRFGAVSEQPRRVTSPFEDGVWTAAVQDNSQAAKNVSQKSHSDGNDNVSTSQDAGLTSSTLSELDASSQMSHLSTSDWFSMDLTMDDSDTAPFASFPFVPLIDSIFPPFACDLSEAMIMPVSQDWCDIAQTAQGMDAPIQTPVPTKSSFLLQQIDPLEAKCVEMRELLSGAEPLVHGNDVSRYITRENALACGQLYGSHLARNIPILHTPSFNISEAPAVLVLAVLLGGACYDGVLIPANIVTKFAMGLLVMIESQMPELNMAVSGLATAQASLIACCILTGSRHDGARRFASIHWASSISMADQLGLFTAQEDEDEEKPTEQTFNWPRWIQQESRRRVACEILGLEMAFCIFLGRPPSLSPFSFPVRMPGGQLCWEAGDAASCLRCLLDSPQQIDVSSGMRELRSFGANSHRMLQVSEFGMFILILALHSSLFQVIQEEPEPCLSPCQLQTLSEINHAAVLEAHPTREGMTQLADAAVNMHGSPALKQCNDAFRTWKQLWEQRRPCAHEESVLPFSADPLPFWHLAKLYQVLYLCPAFVRDGEEFEVPMRKLRRHVSRDKVHDRIVSWLSGFRGQDDTDFQSPRTDADRGEASAEMHCLSVLMKPS